ncbi:MAG: copper resistance system multicopper oxidase [Opitutaceae bacterium]|nr:copper resistance system multicopper oxidase [Opitutaceae bacterium]
MPRAELSPVRAYALGSSRRDFLRAAGAAGLWAGLSRLAPAYAQTPHAGHSGATTPSTPAASAASAPGNPTVVELTIDKMDFRIGDRVGQAVTVNGSLPARLLRFRQGQDVELRVTNRLKERTSIHWHGILLPNEMDGVPGVTFKGVDPGETFIYRFPLKQYGTYWYHSHSGMQEQLGLYGPFIIDPAEPEPFNYSREHTVVLSDWTFADPHRLLAKLKKQSNFSNMQQRTLGDFFDDVSKKGFKQTWAERAMWGKMRMDPTDIADLTGTYFNFLLNGRPAATPWTGTFRPGERVRLRIINSAATTHFDVRIPGLKMTVVQADGQHVKPVEVEEFRMGAAETYDVLVEPTEDRAYALFAESTDRSGFALGTLAPREGMMPEIPAQRKRPLRTMADMGMGDMAMGDSAMGKMEMGGKQKGGMSGMSAADHSAMMGTPKPAPTAGAMPGMNQSAHGSNAAAPSTPAAPTAGGHAGHGAAPSAGTASAPSSSAAPSGHEGMAGMSSGHGGMGAMKNEFGPGNSMMAMSPMSRAHEPGTGLGEDGRRVLVYRDLVGLDARPMPAPEREITMNITGNMERFIWGFDGKKFSESEPIRLRFGERVRVTFINHTMMEHPLHLHGMFMELENGAEGLAPLKHTVTVKPGEKISVLVTADARGDWAFHCHLQYHMDAGMFRVFSVA